jgi:alkylation response protein AidB-like acyl-CoA dehydrogenase
MTTELLRKPPAPGFDWIGAAEEIGRAIAPKAAKHDAEDLFVSENFALLKAQGFFKALVPAEQGGPGAAYGQICEAIRHLGAACGSTALAFSMHSHLVATAAWRWRHTQAPTDGLLRRVAAENLLLVSSGGSDWLKGSGTAEKVEGGFRINARKIFSSGAPAGDLLMTSAVYDDPAAGPTVLHFAVPFKAEGVAILDTWQVMGMRGTGSNDVLLKNVFVPEAAIAGRRPQGKWHPLFHIISMLAFPMVYSAYLGVADFARGTALALARAKPGDNYKALIAGEMETQHAAAEMALQRMIAIAETAKPGPETTSRIMIAKSLAAAAAIRTVEQAMELAGGAAFYRKAGLERAFRDIQAARFHPLQEKPQARFSGCVALGLDVDG